MWLHRERHLQLGAKGSGDVPDVLNYVWQSFSLLMNEAVGAEIVRRMSKMRLGSQPQAFCHRQQSFFRHRHTLCPENDAPTDPAQWVLSRDRMWYGFIKLRGLLNSGVVEDFITSRCVLVEQLKAAAEPEAG